MAEAGLIGLDWGTTSFRAALLDRDGRPLERNSGPFGITAVVDGDYDTVFEQAVGAWCARHPGLPVLASGMVGARTGWREAAYVACPADRTAIAARLLAFTARNGAVVRIVPGLSTRDAAGVPDVLRGEEVQILGALERPDGSALMVLPGTHSKWAKVEGGKVAGFASYLTGELFAALRRHTILGRTMSGDAHDAEAFARGVRRAADGVGGGLLRRLFGARALALFGELGESGGASWLSGLLIGAELVEAKDEFRAERIVLVGGAMLAARYAEAAALLEIATSSADPDAAHLGQAQIARAAGLI